MTGRFIAVVGPSGVGKDSVMHALAARDPRLTLVRRTITRAADAGGEDSDSVTPDIFARRQAAGDFALHWQAHGLSYGIPATVDTALETGRDVLANLSRGVLVAATDRFPTLTVITLTAPPDILAARLALRGRESGTAITRRLKRTGAVAPLTVPAHAFDNSGPLDQTAAAILALLYPENLARCS